MSASLRGLMTASGRNEILLLSNDAAKRASPPVKTTREPSRRLSWRVAERKDGMAPSKSAHRDQCFNPEKYRQSPGIFYPRIARRTRINLNAWENSSNGSIRRLGIDP